MKQIRVVIADDHDVVRAGFRDWLEREDDIVVVGEARNGKESLAQVRELTPDVLLQDIQMPGIDGLEVIRTLRGEDVATRVLAITGFTGRSARAAIESGACGYLSKEEKRELIVEAVAFTHLVGQRQLSGRRLARALERDGRARAVGERGIEHALVAGAIKEH